MYSNIMSIMVRKNKNKGVFWALLVIVIAIIAYLTYPQWGSWIKERLVSNPEELPVQLEPENAILIDNTWVSDMDGTLMTLKSNGDFSLEVPSVEQRKAIYGHYRVQGDKILFVNHPSTNVCVGIEGLYRFELDEDLLVFTLISDGCSARKQYMKEAWAKL